MKHFMNIFVSLVLVGFAVGITWCIMTTGRGEWSALYLPLIIGLGFWGDHLKQVY